MINFAIPVGGLAKPKTHVHCRTSIQNSICCIRTRALGNGRLLHVNSTGDSKLDSQLIPMTLTQYHVALGQFLENLASSPTDRKTLKSVDRWVVCRKAGLRS